MFLGKYGSWTNGVNVFNENANDEIQIFKEVGGHAVASDEYHNGSGLMDECKRNRLKGFDADIVIPDFRYATSLLQCILNP